jgi:GntR family phosphonate transport system transcriptional regulator
LAVAEARSDWLRIAAALRRAIEGGTLDAGARIATEPELMRRFRATRYAVRRALARLQDDGLVRIEQGRGTFVHDGFLVSYRLGDRARFTDVLIESQVTPGQEILRIEQTAAAADVAAALRIAVRSPLLTMEILGYADGQVVKHDLNHFPLPRFATLEPVLRRTGSVTEALKEYGVADYRRRSTSIVGRLPTAAEARLLRQLPSQPVFDCVRLDVDLDGAPILAGRTLFSCERVRLTLGS